MNIGHLKEIGAALCDAILQFSFFEKLLINGPRLQSQSRIKTKAEQCYPTLKHQHYLQHQHQHQHQDDIDIDVEVESKVRVDVAVGCGTKINQLNKMKGMSHRNDSGKVNCDYDNLGLKRNENSGSHGGEGVIRNTVSERGEYICSTLTSFPSSSTAFSSLHGNTATATATAVTSTDGTTFNNHSEDAGTYRIFVRLYNLISYSLFFFP